MNTTLRLALASLAILAAQPARAFEPKYDYATLRAGVFLPAGEVADFSSAPQLEASVGRAFLDFLAAEIAVGYLAASSELRPAQYEVAPGTWEWIDERERIRIVPMTASIRLILPAGTIEPYLVGGAGLYVVSLEKAPVRTIATRTESATSLGFHAGAGATLQLGRRLYAGLDARHQFLGVRGLFEMGTRTLYGTRVSASISARF